MKAGKVTTGKVSKSLWISGDVAAEFDRVLSRLSEAIGDRIDAGELAGAAFLMFFMEPPDRQLLAIRNQRAYPIDRLITALREGEVPPVLSEDVVALLSSYLRGRQAVRSAAQRAARPGKRSKPAREA